MVDKEKWTQARGYWLMHKSGYITLAEFWAHVHYLNYGTFNQQACA